MFVNRFAAYTYDTMSPSRVSKKPHVVSLGVPKFAGAAYLEAFGQNHDFDVLDAANRQETQKRLPEMITGNGPVDYRQMCHEQSLNSLKDL